VLDILGVGVPDGEVVLCGLKRGEHVGNLGSANGLVVVFLIDLHVFVESVSFCR